MYYYLSLGTNIEPEINATRMLCLLYEAFGEFHYMPFIYTQPEDMQSEHLFLNALAVVNTPLTHTAVKSELNRIETSLGRDRNDPRRSVKDRPADIDIIVQTDEYNEAYFQQFDEPYIQRVLEFHCSRCESPAFQGTTAINFDGSPGHKVVIQDPLHCLEDR